jgi:hypothetical protein
MDYPGLYRAAGEFRPPTAAELATVEQFPETTRPSSLVEAMVAIDEHFSWLRLSQRAGWTTPPDHADISPPHEATLLWEQYQELARTEDTAKRPADYRQKLSEAESAAGNLRILLAKPADAPAPDAAFKPATQTCAACHKTYRN